MRLFKPLYLDDRQKECEREKALKKEKNLQRLREFALDRTQPEHLRGDAIIKANDPGLCEAVLMERASESPASSLMPFQLEHYEKAALVLSELGEQKRLEKILALCVKYQIQVIVMNYIKNTEIVREFALDRNQYSEARSVAIVKVNDPELCEAVLMERASDAPVKEPVVFYTRVLYEKAALVLSELGEQKRLEKILASCGSRIIKGVVTSHIKNADLLLKVAIDENEEYFYPDIDYSGPNAPYEAVKLINKNDKLALIALQATNIGTSIQAVAKIRSQELLGEILKNSPHIGVKLKALSRIEAPGKYTDLIRNETIPGIIEKPLYSDDEIRLLAMTGDKIGRTLLWVMKGGSTYRSDKKLPLNQHTKIPEADADILITAMENIIKELSNDTSGGDYRDLFERIAECIRFLHENGIKKERIEKELPRSLTYHYDFSTYDICYEADYFEIKDHSGEETVTFW